MTLGKSSISVSVHDYFVNPISNYTAVKCLIGEKKYGSSDSAKFSKYLSESAIQEMIYVNSEIKAILSKFKISVKVNMKILDNLAKNHLPQTRDIALGIVECLPENLQSKVNKKALADATILHDIAKVIMPENIVNKAGTLTMQEREIMEKHAVLSYEMLKTTDLDEFTLNLIKNHHHESANDDINLQILSIADVYSALREKRCYKSAMSRKQALKILSDETREGKFHHSVYTALNEYVNKNEGFKIKNIFAKFLQKPAVKAFELLQI